jgi:hypothetical protein
MLDEVQRQFSKEFDYTREARDQETVRKELQRVSNGLFCSEGKARAGWHLYVPGQGVRPPLCSSPQPAFHFLLKLIMAFSAPSPWLG